MLRQALPMSVWRVRRSSATPFAYRRTVAGTAVLSLHSVRIAGTVSGPFDTGDDLVVAWLVAGTGVVAGRDVRVGQPALYPEGPFSIAYDRIDLHALRIRRSVVVALAAERAARSGTAPGAPDAPGGVPAPSPDQVRAWWAAVRALAPDLHEDAPLTAADEARLLRQAASAVLDLFPEAGGAHPHGPVERADAFIREHMRAPLSIPDIAAAAGISPRGLQQAFQRELGTTPTRHLLRRRLDAVNVDLLAALPGSTTVAAVASSWGFRHLGRFSASYRARFGESPGASLRRV